MAIQTTPVEQPKVLPPVLLTFLVKVSELLTGEQLKAAWQAVREAQYSHHVQVFEVTPTIVEVAKLLLDDPGVAEWYGHERNQALALLREQRERAGRALSDFVSGSRDYTLYGALLRLQDSASTAIAKYVEQVESLKAASEGRSNDYFRASRKDDEQKTRMGLFAGDFHLAELIEKLSVLCDTLDSSDAEAFAASRAIVDYWKAAREAKP